MFTRNLFLSHVPAIRVYIKSTLLFRNFSILLFFFIIYFAFPGFVSGQLSVSIDSVDFHRIQQKSVRHLIRHQKHFGVRTFNDLCTVCYNNQESDTYNSFRKSVLIRQNIDVVWNNLVHQSPSAAFDGLIVTFGLLYSKSQNNFLYKDQTYAGIETGQTLFLNLRLLRGIRNIAVAMEVTRLDNDEKVIEYCYIDHGSTQGTQKFSLKSTPEGFTEISHESTYKSKALLRSQGLYSFFHGQVVNEFFNTIKTKSETPKNPVAQGM